MVGGEICDFNVKNGIIIMPLWDMSFVLNDFYDNKI